MTSKINSKCMKCGGTGKVRFKHIENGKCFACNGTGLQSSAAATRNVFSTKSGRYVLMVESDEFGFVVSMTRDHDATFLEVSRQIDASQGEGRRWQTIDRHAGKIVAEWHNP